MGNDRGREVLLRAMRKYSPNLVVVETRITKDPFSKGKDFYVVESTHPIYVKGSRFGPGASRMATSDGYAVVMLPESNGCMPKAER